MDSLSRIHRMTKQRQVILEVLRTTDTHPTADWLYEKVRTTIPRISLGTVYRNLRVLKEMGDIKELNYGSTYSRFDGNPDDHYHFTCLTCGAVQDIPIPILSELNQKAAESTGARINFHRLEFYGCCPECLVKKKQGGLE